MYTVPAFASTSNEPPVIACAVGSASVGVSLAHMLQPGKLVDCAPQPATSDTGASASINVQGYRQWLAEADNARNAAG